MPPKKRLLWALGLAWGLLASGTFSWATRVDLEWIPSNSSNVTSYNFYFSTYSFNQGGWISTAAAAADPNVHVQSVSASTPAFCYDAFPLTTGATYYFRETAVDGSGRESVFNQTGGADAQVSLFIDAGLYVNLTATDTARLVLNPANPAQAIVSLQMYDPAFPGAASVSATVGMPSGNKALTLTQFTSTPTIYYAMVASTTFQWSDYYALTGAWVPVTVSGQTFFARGQGNTLDAALGGLVQESSGAAQVSFTSADITQDARVTISSEPADIGGIRAAALASQSLASLGTGRSLILSSCASSSTATITFPYNPAALPPGIPASQATIAYYNPNTVSWEPQTGASVNASAKTVSAPVTHFALSPSFTLYYAIYEPVVLTDTVPPTVAITAPSNNATVSGTIPVSGTAGDNLAVSSVAVSIDGGAYQAATGTATWTYSLNTTLLSNSAHTVRAKAWDPGGNASTKTIAINVNNAPAAGRMGAYWKFDEASGQTLLDSTSTNNGFLGTGAAVEGVDPARVAGRVNGGLSFNASSNTLATFAAAPSSLINYLSSFTYAAWIYPTGWGGGNLGRILSKESSAGFDDNFLFVSVLDGGAANTLAFNLGNGAQDVVAAANSIRLNAWQFVAVTYNDGTDRTPHLYVNGMETAYAAQPAETGSLLVSSRPFVVGNRAARDRGFSGFIDEARVYNYALNSASVLGLYQNTAPGVAISAPAPNAVLSGVVVVSGTAIDVLALSSVAVSVDGGAFSLASGTSSWSMSLDTTLLSNAAHTATVQAWNGAGAVATASVAFTVDNISTYTYVYLAWSSLNLSQAVIGLQSTDPAFPSSPSLSAAVGFPSGAQSMSLSRISSSPLQYSGALATASLRSTDFFYPSPTFVGSVVVGASSFASTLFPRGILPALGGAVLESSGPAEVSIAAGQITQAAQITISSEPAGNQSSYLPASGLGSLGPGRDIAFVSSGALVSAMLTLPFQPQTLPSGMSLSSARLAYFNPATSRWEAVSSATTNGVDYLISAAVAHFSVYEPVILMPTTLPGLIAASSYPNPAVPPYDPVIRICPGIVDSIEVTIYDLSGRAVDSSSQFNGPLIPTQGAGAGQYCYEHVWSGKKSSGVYFAVIHAKAAGTTVRARVKLAVIR